MNLINLESVEFSNCNENSAGGNFNRIDLGNEITFWYSYETIVAFKTRETGFCVTENVWGPTTGKHLNWISNKSQRLPREEFLNKLNSLRLNIEVVEVGE